MLRWAIILFIIALIAGLLGFTAIAGVAFLFAKVLFFIFLIPFLILLILLLA